MTTDDDRDLPRAPSLEELLPTIREELGDDAVIIRQREGLVGGIGGFFAQALRRGRGAGRRGAAAPGRARPARCRPGRVFDAYDDAPLAPPSVAGVRGRADRRPIRPRREPVREPPRVGRAPSAGRRAGAGAEPRPSPSRRAGPSRATPDRRVRHAARTAGRAGHARGRRPGGRPRGRARHGARSTRWRRRSSWSAARSPARSGSSTAGRRSGARSPWSARPAPARRWRPPSCATPTRSARGSRCGRSRLEPSAGAYRLGQLTEHLDIGLRDRRDARGRRPGGDPDAGREPDGGGHAAGLDRRPGRIAAAGRAAGRGQARRDAPGRAGDDGRARGAGAVRRRCPRGISVAAHADHAARRRRTPGAAVGLSFALKKPISYVAEGRRAVRRAAPRRRRRAGRRWCCLSRLTAARRAA